MECVPCHWCDAKGHICSLGSSLAPLFFIPSMPFLQGPRKVTFPCVFWVQKSNFLKNYFRKVFTRLHSRRDRPWNVFHVIDVMPKVIGVHSDHPQHHFSYPPCHFCRTMAKNPCVFSKILYISLENFADRWWSGVIGPSGEASSDNGGPHMPTITAQMYFCPNRTNGWSPVAHFGTISLPKRWFSQKYTQNNTFLTPFAHLSQWNIYPCDRGTGKEIVSGIVVGCISHANVDQTNGITRGTLLWADFSNFWQACQNKGENMGERWFFRSLSATI